METTGNFNQQPPKSNLFLNAVIIVVAILLIVFVGYWVFNGGAQETANEMNEIEKLRTQSGSDEVADIEADLNASEFDALDKELQQIEEELSF